MTRVGIAVDSRAVGIAIVDEQGCVVEAFTVRARLAGRHTPEHPHDDPVVLAGLAAQATDWIKDAVDAHHSQSEVTVAIDLGQPTGIPQGQSQRASSRSLAARSAGWGRAVVGGAIVLALRRTEWSVVAPCTHVADVAVLPETLIGARPSAWRRLAPARHPRGGDRRAEQAAYRVACAVAIATPAAPPGPPPARGSLLADALRRRTAPPL